MGSVHVITETVHEPYQRPWSSSRRHDRAHLETPRSSSTSRQIDTVDFAPASPSSSYLMHQHPSSQSLRASPATSCTTEPLQRRQRSSERHEKSDRLALHQKSMQVGSDSIGNEDGAISNRASNSLNGDATIPHDDSNEANEGNGTEPSPPRIKVRDLQHIQSFDDVALDRIASSRPPSPGIEDAHGVEVPPQYEISEMPVSDVIEMVAGLLTKITTTNDAQHKHIHRSLPTAESTMGMSQQTASVLAFHGKNVPNITIMSYLTRIHKYCPATFEVFLSLLVYFDRMTDKVNSAPLRDLQQSAEQIHNPNEREHAGDYEKGENSQSSGLPSPPLSDSDPSHLQHFFVVDSYNIHRLVIAGVTCASKFFSDIFYTNSRYAKVGGLPLSELNHLELQFLLLNDFRLSISTEELEAYATMLVEFYAREIVAQRRDDAASAVAQAAM